MAKTELEAKIRGKRNRDWKRATTIDGFLMNVNILIEYKDAEKLNMLISKLNANGELGLYQRKITYTEIIRKALLGLNYEANTLDEVVFNKS